MCGDLPSTQPYECESSLTASDSEDMFEVPRFSKSSSSPSASAHPGLLPPSFFMKADPTLDSKGEGKGRDPKEEEEEEMEEELDVEVEELTVEELIALEESSRQTSAPDLRAMQEGIHTLNRITSGQELEDTPANFNGTLLKHQQIGLSWMVRRERGKDPQGGILADDQGLGKTIQAIALMLKNPPVADKPGDREPFRTLVVAPVSLLSQWKKEIRKFSK
jgi:SNF2 family DNA or RNA helicase